MKAINKKRLPVYQRDLIEKESYKQYEKIKAQHEETITNRLLFMVLLSMSLVLDEQLGYGITRRKRFIEAFKNKINELSAFLYDNRCEDGNGHKDFDVEYNRDFLKRLAEQQGIAYNELMFDDLFELQ